jgi:hypothetical protein
VLNGLWNFFLGRSLKWIKFCFTSGVRISNIFLQYSQILVIFRQQCRTSSKMFLANLFWKYIFSTFSYNGSLQSNNETIWWVFVLWLQWILTYKFFGNVIFIRLILQVWGENCLMISCKTLIFKWYIVSYNNLHIVEQFSIVKLFSTHCDEPIFPI